MLCVVNFWLLYHIGALWKSQKTWNPLRCKIASWVKHFHPPTLRPLHTWGTSPRQTDCVSVDFFFLLAAFHHFILVTSLSCQTLICVVRFQEIIIFPPVRDDPTVTCAYFSDGFVDSTTNKLWHWQFQWVTRHPHPSLECHLWPSGICRDTVTRNPQVGRKIRAWSGVLEICEGHLKSNKKNKQPNSKLYSIWWNVCIFFFFDIQHQGTECQIDPQPKMMKLMKSIFPKHIENLCDFQFWSI